MRKGISVGMVAVMVVAMSLMGCKKKVPTNIVQRSLRNALRLHAPQTTSAMCGTKVRGLINASVTNITVKPDGKTGSAHISGKPWVAPGAPPLCEGDVDFRYTSTSKTRGTSRRRRTTTTWFLEHVKLTAVQTKGVAFQTVDEDADDDDDDDDDKK